MAYHQRYQGLYARYEIGTHSIVLYLGECAVYEWPVARNELPQGGEEPQHNIDRFAARKLREMFDMVYRNLEE